MNKKMNDFLNAIQATLNNSLKGEVADPSAALAAAEGLSDEDFATLQTSAANPKAWSVLATDAMTIGKNVHALYKARQLAN
jgi:hypothetical protein